MKLGGLIFLILPLLVAGQSNKGIFFEKLKPTYVEFQHGTGFWNSFHKYPIVTEKFNNGKVDNYTAIDAARIPFGELPKKSLRNINTYFNLTAAWKQSKNTKITAGIGLKQDYYSINGNGSLHFTDQFEPGKGYVSPSNFQLTEQRYFLYSLTEYLGFAVSIPVRKIKIEFENGLGTSQLLKARTELQLKNFEYTEFKYLLEGDLGLDELKHWQYSMYNAIRLAVDINSRFQVMAGLYNQMYFNNLDNKWMNNKDYPRYVGGYFQLNYQMGLRYYIDTM